ncbi:hypothetical protein [Periweissella ghanensis]|uniref:Uncharacterized protein n=1 Tax=Periweissella ghanensis TaxID=467997 RepID=A0ABM8ZAY3_9LACO|nr:hypothetical protein [Periweissella ghanensis]MCM0601244.1 hypothetical protein [Periweissella ghanensis]CAH0418044.1 hypothetical protein WGH24286_00460 [Periweissella ghanensis]
MTRNASGSIFGWEFQICMSIILSLQYIEKLSKIEIEGMDQDVELYMSDSSKILCQSKGYSGQDVTSGITGWKEKLESAMDSLFQNYVEKEV